MAKEPDRSRTTSIRTDIPLGSPPMEAERLWGPGKAAPLTVPAYEGAVVFKYRERFAHPGDQDGVLEVDLLLATPEWWDASAEAKEPGWCGRRLVNGLVLATRATA
jgi:hypothetical protein